MGKPTEAQLAALADGRKKRAANLEAKRAKAKGRERKLDMDDGGSGSDPPAPDDPPKPKAKRKRASTGRETEPAATRGGFFGGLVESWRH